MLLNFFKKIPAIVWVVLSYTLLAVLFTWPLVAHFSTHLLGAPEDNQQFYWNLWWWQKALGEGQNPFHTTWLFFPHGTSLLLHTIYHQPNGWDFVPEGSKIPYGESCMWGDYHFREVALYLQRIINNEPYYAFFK